MQSFGRENKNMKCILKYGINRFGITMLLLDKNNKALPKIVLISQQGHKEDD